MMPLPGLPFLCPFSRMSLISSLTETSETLVTQWRYLRIFAAMMPDNVMELPSVEVQVLIV